MADHTLCPCGAGPLSAQNRSGLCTRCSKRAWNRNAAARLAANHKCPGCGTKRAEPGRHYCEPCKQALAGVAGKCRLCREQLGSRTVRGLCSRCYRHAYENDRSLLSLDRCVPPEDVEAVVAYYAARVERELPLRRPGLIVEERA